MTVRQARGWLVAALDILGAVFLLFVWLVMLVGQLARGHRPARPPPYGRHLLVLDSAYTLETVRKLGIEGSLLARDLDGYFEHVWSVHPFVGADPSQVTQGAPGGVRAESLTPHHTVLEGRRGRFQLLRGLPTTNFVAAQLGLFLHLHRLCSQKPISAIRAGDPYYLGLLGIALSRIHRLPLAVRVNGNYDEIFASLGKLAYPNLFKRRWVEKRIDRFVLSRAELVAGANRNNMAFALANGADPGRCHVFPYGNLIAAVHFAPPEERQDRLPAHLRGLRYVVYVGRLEPVKYPQDVIEMLALIRERHADLHAVLIGDGSLRQQLLDLAVERSIEDRIVFTGPLEQAAVAAAMSHAHAIVAPHMGRALVEAALSARPVVAYDHEWHGELIDSERTGLLVPFRDTRSLAEAIDRLVLNPDLASRLGLQARAAALTRMDPESLTARERAAYDDVFAADAP